MADPTAPSFRVRFRFRVQKKLAVDEPELRFHVGEREAVLTAAADNAPIRTSEWLVANVRGFETLDDARAFGARLKAACEVASVATRLGIDSGRDRATTALGEGFREELRRRTGHRIRDNVHGIDVFEDGPDVRVVGFSATGTVTINPSAFVRAIVTYAPFERALSERARIAILLLNRTLMQSEPVAQIVFSVSAVETLGQLAWSEAQASLLAELIEAARTSTRCPPGEREEVADALARGAHRVSLRQGVLRLLSSLGLSELKRDWDALYSERSILIHGRAPAPGADYTSLAHRTVSLCGRVLLTVLAREVADADAYVSEFYI